MSKRPYQHLPPLEHRPDGSPYRITPPQKRRASGLIRRECCNCEDGNCLALDDGDTCACPQMISFSVCCKWFRWAVLPLDRTLEAEIYRDRDLKRCAECGGVFVPKSNPGQILPGLRRQSFTGGRKQKVNGKGGLLWTVKSGISLDLQGSASPQPGRLVSFIIRPGKRASNRPTKHAMTNTIYIHQPEKAFSFTRLPNFLFEAPTFQPLSTKRRCCMPLSCAGRSCPGRTAGRTSTGGSTCTTHLRGGRFAPLRAAESGQHPAGVAVCGAGGNPETGLWKTQPHLPEIYEAVPNTDFKKSGYGTPEG